MSKLPSALLSNAMRWLSGAHRGVPECLPTVLSPVLVDSKATRLPSGEYCGFQSDRVDETNRDGTDASAVGSASVVRQISSSSGSMPSALT